MAWSWVIDDEIRDRVDRLRIPFNRHGIDPYGISKNHVAFMHTVFGALYQRYFHVTTSGIEHVPDEGGAMLVGNHSGGWALDGMMVLSSLLLDKEPPRLAHGMAEYFINEIPFGSLMSSRTGNFTGTPENATHLLEDGRVLLVFPEGARGTAKLYKERNSLVRFGTGFVRLALQSKTPIVPFGFAGGGEAIPTIMNLYKLGKLVGVPYLPVTPWGLPLPRPVPLHISYGAPMVFEGTGAEDDSVISGFVDEVKERIAALIDDAVQARGRS